MNNLPNRKECSKCGKLRYLNRDFYMSNSDKHRDGKISVCKQCLTKEMKADSLDDLKTDVYIKKLQDILLEMNRPYIHKEWISTIEEAKERNRTPSGTLGLYLKNINLNHRDKDWRDSEFAEDIIQEKDEEKNNTSTEKVKVKHGIELDNKNEKDVLRLLGYDPFENEAEEDRPGLFNKLIDYLDESTLEDGFKLSSVIELTKTFNQIDKINAAISKVMSDVKGFSKNAGSITSLVNAKDKMYKSVLEIAKENGISVKHATNKSKGAGTLSGIIKQLQEYDIHEAEVNLFDVETSEGIRQVADISNASIMRQLQFDENDYSTMIQEQRVLIEEYREKAERFEEEARLLKIKLMEKERKEKELQQKIIELGEKLNSLTS